MGQRDEDFSGIWARVWAWVLGVFSEAEGAELVGDALDGGFGEGLSVGGELRMRNRVLWRGVGEGKKVKEKGDWCVRGLEGSEEVVQG
uniref:Uncharacterized protein n=1 Tax=Fagus sylvatica TaxID=28930 RepID=A0A2N9HX15_FAGSY